MLKTNNILKPNITKFYKILCKQQQIFDASEISEILVLQS